MSTELWFWKLLAIGGAVALAVLALVAGARGATQPWQCRGPVNIELLKLDAVDDVAAMLQPGCTGRIGRIEITTNRDGIKGTNSSTTPVHDLVVESGFIRCTYAPAGTHQDGIQMMAGTRVRFLNLEISGCRTGMVRFVKAGSGVSTPTDVTCEGCYLGPGSAHTAVIGASVRSGLINTVACPDTTKFNGAIEIKSAAQQPVNVGNTQPAACP